MFILAKLLAISHGTAETWKLFALEVGNSYLSGESLLSENTRNHDEIFSAMVSGIG